MSHCGIFEPHLSPKKTNETKPLQQSDEKTLLTHASSTVSFGTEDENSTDSQQYKLYAQRWLVLASFCLLNVSNGLICLIWSPLTAMAADFWDTTESAVDALGGIYMAVFVPTNIFSMWLVVTHLGLAKGLQLGALLNMVGSTVIYSGGAISRAFPHFSDYHVVYFGTILAALGQAFILPMIALLSGSWFGELERATATSIGALAFQFGSLIALASTAVVDFRNETGKLDGHKLDQYLRVQWFISLAAFAMVVITIRKDRPLTPPSEAAATLTQSGGVAINYSDSIRLVLQSPSSRTFFCLFGMVVGSFYALPVFLSQFMPMWTPREQGLLGGIFQIAAVSGCFAAGKFVSLFHLQYKKIALLLLGGCLLSTILYLVSVYTQSYLAMVACGGMGFFFSSFMSVGIEFGTALTFPADEAAVYGILDSTGELSGFLLVALGGSMSHMGHDVAFCGILVGFVAVAFFCLWRLEEHIRRPSFRNSDSMSS